MKNVLNYYYGLVISTIHQKDKTFYFKHDGYEYIFTRYEDANEINDIYNLSTALLNNGINCHQLILNNFKQILTKVNDENYILLKIFVQKRKINIHDVINFNNLTVGSENTKLNNWYDLWTNKIDYFEYQISQIGKKYPLIRESFSYYIGLSENAITLVKNVQKDKLYYSLNHRRIYSSDTTYDLYNPLNFIIDSRIRDICEYFKSCFFNDENIEEEIQTYLFYNKLNYDEGCYFMARMLFPTYYFDLYEKIINNEIDETNIKLIISKSLEYENLLRKIHYYLKLNANIPDIEWLKKVIQY